MKAFPPVFARELAGFARSPLTYLIMALLGLISGMLAFPPGGGGVLQDSSGYLRAWPWLLAGLGTAFGARVWARELRAGSLLRVLSEPAPLWHLACAKILAAWVVALCAALVVYAPALSAAWLGRVDGGALIAAIFSAALLLGAFVALGAAASAAAHDEAFAFALAFAVTLCLVVVTDPPAGAPIWLEDFAQFSPVIGFEAARQGVLELGGVFQSVAAMIAGGLLSIIALEARRAG